MSGLQAAFNALCYAADAANFWRGGHLPPSPVGEGFSGCLPTCGRAAAQRVGMAAIRHALPLNLLPPFGFAFSHNVMGNGE